LHLPSGNLNFCQFQAGSVISPVTKKDEAALCPAPAYQLLVDLVRKGEKIQSRIISPSSPYTYYKPGCYFMWISLAVEWKARKRYAVTNTAFLEVEFAVIFKCRAKQPKPHRHCASESATKYARHGLGPPSAHIEIRCG
jgi:hypothetical protein